VNSTASKHGKAAQSLCAMSGSTFHPNHREWNSLFRQTAEKHGKLTGYVSSPDKYRPPHFSVALSRPARRAGSNNSLLAVNRVQGAPGLAAFARPGSRAHPPIFTHPLTLTALSKMPEGLHRLIGAITSRDSTRVLEQTRSGSSEDKAADMRQVCHATGLHLCHSACVEELSEKPKTN
jgi:hypothetical protein